MNRIKMKRSAVCVLAATVVGLAAEAKAEWTAERVAVTEGFQTPESAAVDPDSGIVYVSNVVTGKSVPGQGPWDEDGRGFISRLKPGGHVDVLKWKESQPDCVLNGPKGISLGWGRLWIADITRLVRFDLAGEGPGRPFSVQGAKRLNDVATDGKAVYLSDTAAGNVHRIARGEHGVLKAPEGVNGITLSGAKMYAVSWTLHDVYELDPSGEGEPHPLGLADHFTALDGIEVLDDGTILVSDFPAGKVSAIDPGLKTVRTLLETTTPADIGLDRKRLLLYVPLFTADCVEVYQLDNR